MGVDKKYSGVLTRPINGNYICHVIRRNIIRLPSDVAAGFQGESLLRPHRGRGEEVSREPVRAGLRPRALVRVVALLHDVRHGKEDQIEASQVHCTVNKYSGFWNHSVFTTIASDLQYRSIKLPLLRLLLNFFLTGVNVRGPFQYCRSLGCSSLSSLVLVRLADCVSHHQHAIFGPFS